MRTDPIFKKHQKYLLLLVELNTNKKNRNTNSETAPEATPTPRRVVTSTYKKRLQDAPRKKKFTPKKSRKTINFGNDYSQKCEQRIIDISGNLVTRLNKVNLLKEFMILLNGIEDGSFPLTSISLL